MPDKTLKKYFKTVLMKIKLKNVLISYVFAV